MVLHHVRGDHFGASKSAYVALWKTVNCQRQFQEGWREMYFAFGKQSRIYTNDSQTVWQRN